MSPADAQALLDSVTVTAFTAGLIGTIAGLCLHGVVTGFIRFWMDKP